MIRRHAAPIALALAAFTAPFTLGCVAPPTDSSEAYSDDELLGTTESSLVETNPGPSAVEILLTSFDLATMTVSGYNKHGWEYTGTLTSTTMYRTAVIDRFIPTDPCREIATLYNQAVLAGEAPIARIDEMVQNSCSAKVWFSPTATIRVFQPMP